jgi:hypothetical protein
MGSARKAGVLLMILGTIGLGFSLLAILVVLTVPMQEMEKQPAYVKLTEKVAPEAIPTFFAVAFGLMALVCAGITVVALLLLRGGRRHARLGTVVCWIGAVYFGLNFIATAVTGAIDGAIFSLILVGIFLRALLWLRASRYDVPHSAVAAPPPAYAPQPQPQQPYWQPGYGQPMQGYYFPPPPAETPPAAPPAAEAPAPAETAAPRPAEP